MGAAFRIAGKDLRLRIRDRSFLIMGVVAPLGIAFVFDLVLGNTTSDAPRYAVVVESGSEVGVAVAAAFEAAAGEVELVEAGSAVDAVALAEEGEIDAAVLVGAGGVEVVGNVDSPTSAVIARSIVEAAVGEMRAVQVAVGTAIAAGSREDPGVLAEAVSGGPRPVRLGPATAAARELDLSTWFSASMATFFLLFTVQSGVVGLLEEREDGTLVRLLAAPIPPFAIVGGKVLTSFALGIVSMAVLAGGSRLLMGADWGDPAGVALLVVAGVAAAVGIMLVVAAFARTVEAAGNLQSIVAVGLGMLGGVFFPSDVSGWLADIAVVSPHRWFLLGLSDLAGGGGAGVVLEEAGALLGFAVAGFGVAAVRLRSMVSVG